MVGVIDGFRRAILGPGFPLYLPGFALSCAVAVALFVAGVLYFRAAERVFADVI
jgi:ABC-type polysaccharide/polyol phosphate export permease